MARWGFLLLLLFLGAGAPLGAARQAQDTKAAPPTLSGSELIDYCIGAKWKDQGIKPAAPTEDAEFCRRAHLDILGVIPPADECLSFIKDKKPNKRAMFIDVLLNDPRYAENWAEIWEGHLIGYDAGLRQQSNDALRTWLREDVFMKNMSYDKMVSEIITAKGVNQEVGATNFIWRFLRIGGSPIDITGKISKTFMGTQIQCAQCHDHPFDKWTQDDFYGVMAFFVRVGQKKVEPQNRQDQRFEILERPNGEASYEYEPGKRKNVPPQFLNGEKPGANEERRVAFARMLTRPDNLQFARALVNRYWGHFFGRGIVHPVDEFNTRNKPSHPDLLDALAKDFVAHKFDLKWLIRAITNTKVYQLASKKPSKGDRTEKSFSYALTRAMSPEQLYNSLAEAVGSADLMKTRSKKQGKEAIQREKEGYLRAFRFSFGDDENVDVLDFAGTIPQALMLLNGGIVNGQLVQRDGRLDLILRTQDAAEDRLNLMYLSALSRLPSPAERARYLTYIQKTGNKKESFEDIYWVLVNSSEFLFNH